MSVRSDWEILQASANAGYVGGGYYNPVNEFVETARPLSSARLAECCKSSVMSVSSDDKLTYVVATIFKELTSQIRPGEEIFAMYDTGNYRITVLIPGEERLMDFEVQVQSGKLTRCGFYALDREQANKGLARDFSPLHSGLPAAG